MSKYEGALWDLAGAALMEYEHQPSDVVTLYQALKSQLPRQAVIDFANQKFTKEVTDMDAISRIICDALFSGRRKL